MGLYNSIMGQEYNLRPYYTLANNVIYSKESMNKMKSILKKKDLKHSLDAEEITEKEEMQSKMFLYQNDAYEYDMYHTSDISELVSYYCDSQTYEDTMNTARSDWISEPFELSIYDYALDENQNSENEEN